MSITGVLCLDVMGLAIRLGNSCLTEGNFAAICTIMQ